MKPMRSFASRPPNDLPSSRTSVRSVRNVVWFALAVLCLSTTQATAQTPSRKRTTQPLTATQPSQATSRPILPTSRTAQHNQAAPHAPPTHTFLNPLRGGYPFVQSVAFSGRGDRVLVGAAGKDGGVRSWSWWSGIEQDFAEAYGDIVQVSFLENDRLFGAWRVYTPGDSLNGNHFTIHKIGENKPIIRSKYGVSFATFSHAVPQTALFGAWREFTFISGGRSQGTLPNEAKHPSVAAITLSSNGRYAAISQRDIASKLKKYQDNILLFDTHKKEQIRTIIRPFFYHLERMALTNDGRHLAITTRGHADIWDLKQGKRRFGIDHRGFPELLPLYSPDQKTFLLLSQASIGQSWTYARTPSGFKFANPSTHKDTHLFFYDAKTYKLQKTWKIQQCFFRTTYFRFGAMRGPEHNPERAAFSPNGRVLALGCNGGVLFYDIKNNKEIKSLPWFVRRPLNQQPPKP